jgi:hypothetical protein
VHKDPHGPAWAQEHPSTNFQTPGKLRPDQDRKSPDPDKKSRDPEKKRDQGKTRPDNRTKSAFGRTGAAFDDKDEARASLCEGPYGTLR